MTDPARTTELDRVLAVAAAESAMEEGLLRAALGLEAGDSVEPRRALLDLPAGGDRDLALAAAVRLVTTAASWLDNHPDWRVAAWAILDRDGADIQAAAGIDSRQQTFEKEPALQGAAAEVEAEFERILGRLTRVDRLKDVRTRFMKWLNQQPTRAAIRPFLSERLAVARFGELCDAVEAYRTAVGPAAVRAFDHAAQMVRSFRGDVETHGTVAGDRFLTPLLSGTEMALVADFEQSALGNPAALAIEGSPKKYPLHEAGRTIAVAITVRNGGRGPADDVRITTTDTTGNVAADNEELYLGRLEETAVGVQIPCTVIAPEEVGILSGRVTWRNYDGTAASETFDVHLQGQRTHVDWDGLQFEDPYSLEPVESEEELSGRSEQMAQLTALAMRKQLGSLILWGQKRVGKTSIARALASRLSRAVDSGYRVLYVESGDYVDKDAQSTISNLGRRLCEELQHADPRLAGVAIPEFDGALKPLGDFLRNCHAVADDLRVLFILDEFDELPIELYRRGPIGDALFLTLRTQSGKPNIGFCLVGGEKMEHILHAQGDHLNKFRTFRVDYFDRAAHWADFQELVRKPVLPWLEVSDDAVAELYDLTAGNPFFTKLIGGDLYRLMIERRDAHVTASEVRQAAESTLQAAASNSFQHFWEDGVVDVGGRVELVSIRRRRILISLARLLRQSSPTTRLNLIREAERLGVSPGDAASEIDDMVRRQVLEQGSAGYMCKVRFFERWLVERGIAELMTQALDPEAVETYRSEDAAAYVSSTELVELVSGWGLYRGAQVTEERVRAWLEQFETPRERRLMFELLTGVRFYTAARVREKLAEAHDMVRRGLKYVVEEGRKKRAEVLISYLDKAGKSGATYARLYASENQIYIDNVAERDRISEALADEQIQAVVFVDDFVGTGSTAAEAIAEIADEMRGPRVVPAYIVAICGFESGQKKIEQAVRKANLRLQVRICDPLGDSDRAFAEGSVLFQGDEDRAMARDVAFRYGRRLVANNPLGFGGGEALVVFDQSIPNNAPPILWAHSPTWEPLFRRL